MTDRNLKRNRKESRNKEGRQSEGKGDSAVSGGSEADFGGRYYGGDGRTKCSA